MTGCGGHSPIDPDPVRPGLYPIDFGISADLEVESKATLIEGDTFDENGSLVKKGNYKDFGFITLSNLTVDANSDMQPSIFGANGTEVKYVSNAWTYSPLRYWQAGTYNFVGVMPSSIFNATHNHTSTTQPGTGSASLTETANGSQLTLNFGTNGFDLASNQHDLMVAFDNVSNTEGLMGKPDPDNDNKIRAVNFNFQHQLSLVIIKGVNKESMGKIRIDKIEVYGNTAKTAGNMVFTHDGTKINASYSLDSQSVTDEDNVYQTIEGAWELAPSAPSTEIVSALLVFPEECDEFYIAVTYTDAYGSTNQVQTKKTSQKLEANWERGKKYTYTFNLYLDHISFGKPTVTDWVSGGNVDTGIEM